MTADMRGMDSSKIDGAAIDEVTRIIWDELHVMPWSSVLAHQKQEWRAAVLTGITIYLAAVGEIREAIPAGHNYPKSRARPGNRVNRKDHT